MLNKGIFVAFIIATQLEIINTDQKNRIFIKDWIIMFIRITLK